MKRLINRIAKISTLFIFDKVKPLKRERVISLMAYKEDKLRKVA